MHLRYQKKTPDLNEMTTIKIHTLTDKNKFQIAHCQKKKNGYQFLKLYIYINITYIPMLLKFNNIIL